MTSKRHFVRHGRDTNRVAAIGPIGTEANETRHTSRGRPPQAPHRISGPQVTSTSREVNYRKYEVAKSVKRDFSAPNAYNRLKIGTHLPWDIPHIWFKGTIRFRGRLRPLRSFDLGRGHYDLEVT